MSRHVRLATFNVEGLDEDEDFDVRLKVLRPQLVRLEADILCLQEVNTQKAALGEERVLRALRRLLEGTAYAPFHTIATTGKEGRLRDIHNLVILSRFPFLETRQYWHDLVPEPRCPVPLGEISAAWDRPILYVALDAGFGKPLHIINVHFRAPLAVAIPGQKAKPFAWKSTASWAQGFYLAAVKRAGQALETRLLVDGIFDRDNEALIAVCGDFNAESDADPVRIVAASEEETGSGALTGRHLVPLEEGLSEGDRYSVLHAGRKIMLDHILASRALLAGFEGLRIHNEGLEDEVIGYTLVERSAVSFHAPLVAEFRLPDTPLHESSAFGL